jgi:hypothetical protein
MEIGIRIGFSRITACHFGAPLQCNTIEVMEAVVRADLPEGGNL